VASRILDRVNSRSRERVWYGILLWRYVISLPSWSEFVLLVLSRCFELVEAVHGMLGGVLYLYIGTIGRRFGELSPVWTMVNVLDPDEREQ